ncbi:hypothetical protein JCM12296A_59200 [Desulfosarcina cetonica]
MLVSIPPKYAVSQVIGYLKGKSAIHIARVYMGQKRNYKGQYFWAGGYHVSTVGRDEKQSGNISESRNRKTEGSVSFRCLVKATPPLGG